MAALHRDDIHRVAAVARGLCYAHSPLCQTALWHLLGAWEQQKHIRLGGVGVPLAQ